MSLYEFFKDKYKRTSYPLMDEHQFDELVAEIRAENELLKKNGNTVVVGIDTDKKTLVDLMTENERLKGELQQVPLCSCSFTLGTRTSNGKYDRPAIYHPSFQLEILLQE